ncbi:MAG: DUF5686 and carboxypeptidase regulatory-like domain-containing protein [Lentimicrobium sp.]|uniref:DUF5686 and carboxypeptidase regulatory-like domain-containing protein n=1 Tax=Lentimicrobium sp. TaxID=2034841 RepID=UPI0025F94573|nr:DUF5686 and carboxypeptidase regulatory-like domain-containing protein [Lentimicrobium sp.]MCO5257136.1 DUF5686 and carboxypeptidase regulatory-like domain-containing protein [Lentimicrobium sp.]
MWFRIILILSVTLSFSFASHSQVLSGVITDEAGKPVPWATVFVKELMYGTVANQDGAFELKLDAGDYTCVFQSMGYQAETRQISIGEAANPMHIQLKSMVYNLSGVVVSSSGEDPAYGIMRQVIRMAPQYAGMVKYYKADVYIRGSLELRSISRMVKWMAREDLKESGIREGDVYMEESVNEIEFTAPSKVNQRVKSIHSNFPRDDESKSSAAVGYISGNLYKPDAFGNAWSPFAPGAFSHYRFALEGTRVNGKVLVSKIRIIPKGKGPKFVRGHVYIIEDLWCIHSIDVQVEEQLGVDIRLSQTYGEVKPSVWLPVSNRMKLDMDLLGNAGGFLYNTSVRYRDLLVNTSHIPSAEAPPVSMQLPASPASSQARRDRLQKKAEKLTASPEPTTSEAYRLARIRQKQEALKARDSLRNDHQYVERYKLSVDSNARVSDTAFWSSIRPIPLARSEVLSVVRNDTLMARRKKDADSTIQPKPAKQRLLSVLLTGGMSEIDSVNRFSSNGLLYPFGVSFSTVDGLTYGTRFTYNRFKTGKYKAMVDFAPAFGFASRDFMWTTSVGLEGQGNLKNKFRISGGSLHPDFNREGGAMAIENALSTLLFRQNLSRLYQYDFIRITHSIQPFFGASLNSGLTLSESTPLQNQSDFSFFYKDSRSFSPNIPASPLYRMERHRDLIFEMELTYKPMPFYYIKDGVKVPRRGLNRAPEFFAGIRKAIPSGSFTTDFTVLHAGLRQEVATGPGERLKLEAEYGKFVTAARIYSGDFTHFSAQPLTVGGKNPFNTFQLINYYDYSTNEAWLRAFANYSSRYLLFTRLPLLRNRLWQEQFSLGLLGVQHQGYHIEGGFGLGNSLYNFGIYSAVNDKGKWQWGFRLAIPVFSTREITVGM